MESKNIFQTIAICTYNNAESLKITLDSLKHIECPDWLTYEILIIDNNCTDHTGQVIEKFSEVFGQKLRCVSECRQGLSHARNCALENAWGEIVSFIDDDVKVDKHWAKYVSLSFRQYQPDVVGGMSYLIYPDKSKPSWITSELEIFLSRLDYGNKPEVGTEKDLFGLNFSVCRKTALEIGGFCTDLGRVGNILASGEESDFLARVKKNGGIAVYEPRAIVGHIVDPVRLKKSWFIRRVYHSALYSQYKKQSESMKNLILLRLSNLSKIAAHMVKALMLGQYDHDHFFPQHLKIARIVGEIRGGLKIT